nr:MAG TPA: hypothetical protein [Caudoviricetes sp.]
MCPVPAYWYTLFTLVPLLLYVCGTFDQSYLQIILLCLKI